MKIYWVIYIVSSCCYFVGPLSWFLTQHPKMCDDTATQYLGSSHKIQKCVMTQRHNIGRIVYNRKLQVIHNK